MPATLCNGSSTTLPPAQCAFWVSLYDNNGGSTHWKNCREWRTDPCACQYTGPNGGNRGITCSLDGHIAVMYVGVRVTFNRRSSDPTWPCRNIAWNNLVGSVPNNWSALAPTLTQLNMDRNSLVGTFPEGITDLKLLTQLYLQDMNVGYGLVGTIPNGVAELTLLQQLGLGAVSGNSGGSKVRTASHLPLPNPSLLTKLVVMA